MDDKQRYLILKLKGELASEDIHVLEDLVEKHIKDFQGINFDLTGLKFIDSSGIGFLINQLYNMEKSGKQANFYFNGEKQEINTSEEILKLCERVLIPDQDIAHKPEKEKQKQEKQAKITERAIEKKQDQEKGKQREKQDNLQSQEKPVDEPEYHGVKKQSEPDEIKQTYESMLKKEKIIEESEIQEDNVTDELKTQKQPAVDSGKPEKKKEKKLKETKQRKNKKSVTDPNYLKENGKQEKKVRPPLIEKYSKVEDPLKKGLYSAGIVLSVIIIMSLFLPLFSQGKVINAWFHFNSGIRGLPVIGSLIIAAVLLIISVIPSLSLHQRAPFLMAMGISGITLWFIFINNDTAFNNTFTDILVNRRALYHLTVATILSGTLLKFISVNPRNRIAFIILGILLFTVVFLYLFPFREYKRIILTELKTKILLKELINGITSARLSVILFKIFMLLPILFVFTSIIVFIDPVKYGSIANYTGNFLVYYFPLIIFLGMFYAGFYIKMILFSHLAFVFLQLTIYTYIFSKGFVYTFSSHKSGYHYHIIPISYSGKFDYDGDIKKKQNLKTADNSI